MKDYSQIADEKSLFDCYLERVYDKGYNKGYADNNKDFAAGVREAYENGLNDAWKCAKKIVCSEITMGLTLNQIYEMFGMNYAGVLLEYSPSEAISKIKEYEEKQKAKQTEKKCDTCKYSDNERTVDEIKVGDEVTVGGKKVIVTNVMNGLWDGFVEDCQPSCVGQDLCIAIKTGRHFDQIEEVLKALRGE